MEFEFLPNSADPSQQPDGHRRLLGCTAAPPPPDAPPLTLEQGHGLLLGLFPANILHNVVHLLFGALG